MGDEVYVYIRGHLVMKRWLKRGVDATFSQSSTLWSTEKRPPRELGVVAMDGVR